MGTGVHRDDPVSPVKRTAEAVVARSGRKEPKVGRVRKNDDAIGSREASPDDVVADRRRKGNDAPGGALAYLAHGRIIGGFALVAYPATYGNSGIMTFMVNHKGVVYQKDLGPNTVALARAIKTYNPDSSWKPVR